MSIHRRHDILAIVILVLCVVGYASFRSDFRLREQMPAEFFDGSHLPPSQRASEEKIARAYWKCAVTQIQWKYGYARRLPVDPPDEFAINKEEVGAPARDSAARDRYWQRLHAIWGTSGIWQQHYEWNPNVFKESLQSGGDWLGRLMRRVTGYS
jgi:hypothetical protein